MPKPKSAGFGAMLGLITVLVVILCGALLNDKMPEPKPSPSPDRPVVIVPQK